MTDQETQLAVRQATELANATSGQHWLTIEDQIRKSYAPKANDPEWQQFVMEARSLGLDPTKREFIALAIGKEKVTNASGRDEWRDKYQGYVTIHGARTLARRTGLLDSSETHWYDEQMRPYEVWLSDEAPAACKVTIYLIGNAGRGFSGVSTKKDFRTFMKTERDPSSGRDVRVESIVPIWKERPEIMLEVRAEMRALRKAGLLSDFNVFDRGVATVDSATGEILVHTGDRAERVAASRRVHAIAASRSVDHEGVRSAVSSIDGEPVSLSDAPVDDMAAAGDLIEVLDADGVATVTGQPAETITGEPFEPVAEPQTQTEWSTPDQDKWIRENKGGLLPSQFTAPEKDYLKGAAPLTQVEADALIGKIARLKASAKT